MASAVSEYFCDGCYIDLFHADGSVERILAVLNGFDDNYLVRREVKIGDLTLEDEEVVDVTIMAYCKCRNKYNPDKGSFATLLFRAVHNDMVSLFRKRAARPKYLSELPLDMKAQSEINYVDLLDSINVIKQSQHKQIVTERYVHGMFIKDVAKKFNVSKQRIFQILSQYRILEPAA